MDTIIDISLDDVEQTIVQYDKLNEHGIILLDLLISGKATPLAIYREFLTQFGIQSNEVLTTTEYKKRDGPDEYLHFNVMYYSGHMIDFQTIFNVLVRFFVPNPISQLAKSYLCDQHPKLFKKIIAAYLDGESNITFIKLYKQHFSLDMTDNNISYTNMLEKLDDIKDLDISYRKTLINLIDLLQIGSTEEIVNYLLSQ
jgi:hypothetical protein